MAVYVDDAGIPADVRSGPVVHSSQWSHLFADTQDELHQFATGQLGLKRSCFQTGHRRGDGRPSPHWHYDLTAGKRQQAIRLGAVPVSWRKAVDIMHERDARAARAEAAGHASHVAGLAYRSGDVVRAARLLPDAAAADPTRAPRWAERAARVNAAARARAAHTAGPGDPRPLAEIVTARLEAAGITAEAPGVTAIGQWNQQRQAAAAHQLPGTEPAPADPVAEPAPGATREAGQ
jgi:Protein of unknown function (DUF4031)